MLTTLGNRSLASLKMTRKKPNHSSSPLGNLLLAACSSRRVPAIAAVLVIHNIRVVPAVPAIAAVLVIHNI